MANLKIDIFCRDGSPLKITPPMIYGRGVGGAELSMMTWAETMARRGHQIRIYNNPDTPGMYDDVEYLPQDDFEPHYNKRDVLIDYRSPTPDLGAIKAGVKIHWSTDQYTIGNYATDIVPFVEKVVCISPYHVRDYQARLVYALMEGKWPRDNFAPDSEIIRQNTVKAPLHKIAHIDLGVRLQDYPAKMEKILNRFIYCSVPERGLTVIRNIWPQIKEAIPDATLVITSDHRLWGAHSPNNHKYRLELLGQDGIVFLGAIERHDLAKHQARSQIHLFPCIYPELFCISAAECQAVGAYPVTSDMGALATTNEFGLQIPGDPQDPAWQRVYIDAVLETIGDQDKLIRIAEKGAKLARKRFDWERICDQWEELIQGQREPKTKR